VVRSAAAGSAAKLVEGLAPGPAVEANDAYRFAIETRSRLAAQILDRVLGWQ
jgi:hypothetical protein